MHTVVQSVPYARPRPPRAAFSVVHPFIFSLLLLFAYFVGALHTLISLKFVFCI